MENFKHIGNLPQNQLADLVNEIGAHPELWNKYTLRTQFTAQQGGYFNNCRDIILHYPAIKTIREMLSEKPVELTQYPAFIELPTVRTFVFWFAQLMQRTAIGRVVIDELPCGKDIPLHTDLPDITQKYERYQLCLRGTDQVAFTCGEEAFNPTPGEIIMFDSSKPHSVVNAGATPRWALIIDLERPKFLVEPRTAPKLELVK